METSTLKTIADLGIGVGTVALILYFIHKIGVYMIDKNKQVFDEIMNANKAKEAWWQEYINSENHQKTDLMEKHIGVMVEVKNVLAENTKAQSANNEIMKEVVNKILMK